MRTLSKSRFRLRNGDAPDDEELPFDGKEIAQGGAAMTAFARRQFE